MLRSLVKSLEAQRGYRSLHQTYPAAKLKHHPDIIKVPDNFRWHRHIFDHVALPRGTSGKPMNFVLSVLFYNQPCRLDSLWTKCLEVPGIPLDSRRHLRQVTHQARMEGWIYFEKKEDTHWYVYFAPDRYEEVKFLVNSWRQDWIESIGDSAKHAASSKEVVNVDSEKAEAKKEHMDHIRQALVDANKRLGDHERTTIDYLPYTDPNGKVNFMWWYEMAVGSQTKSVEAVEDEPRRSVNVAGLPHLTRSV